MHTGEVKLDYLCVEEVTFRGTSQKYRGTVFHTFTSRAGVRKQTALPLRKSNINREV